MFRTSLRWRYVATASPLAIMVAASPVFAADTGTVQPIVAGTSAAATAQPVPPSNGTNGGNPTAATPTGTPGSSNEQAIVITGSTPARLRTRTS